MKCTYRGCTEHAAYARYNRCEQHHSVLECQDCRYWHKPDQMLCTTRGQCRRYAPRAEEFAETRAVDWCGDFEQKEVSND